MRMLDLADFLELTDSCFLARLFLRERASPPFETLLSTSYVALRLMIVKNPAV